MKRLLMLSVLLLAAIVSAWPSFAGTFKRAPINGVPDVYIVVLADGIATGPGHPHADLPAVADVARSLVAAHGGKVQTVWEHALQGFIAHMPEARARELANDPRVLSVEQNFSVSAPVADCYQGSWTDTRTTQDLINNTYSPQSLTCPDPDPLHDTGSGAPVCRDNWGLDRIDQGSSFRNGLFTFTNNGTGVHVYILDTGVRWTQRELQDNNGISRVSGGVDARDATIARVEDMPLGNAQNTDDCYGHGTHVAGIIAARTFGVVKNVNVHPVRIIGCTDSAQLFLDRIVHGLNWIVYDVGNHRQGNPAPAYPSVVNWSGGNATSVASSTAVQAAVQGVVNNRIVLVQAAGNQSGAYVASNPSSAHDACELTMAGTVPQVIVAGGMDFNDGRWIRRQSDPQDWSYCNSSFGDCGSNVGSCIDIWAPAAHIVSSSRIADNADCRLSGTSMAAPHVTGAVAVYLQSNPMASVTDVKRALRSRGTWGALENHSISSNYIGDDSDNVVLNSDTRSGGDWAPEAAFTIACPTGGRQCTLNASGSTDDGTINNYFWSFGDDTVAAGQTVVHTFPANFNGPAVLAIWDNTGKSDHLKKTVVTGSDAPPTANFPYSCTGLTCTFTSTSTDDHGINFISWNFGDGTTGSGSPITHTYASGSTYTVTLTATDTIGQTGTSAPHYVTAVLSPPTNVRADASGATVTISWMPSTGASGYNIERKVSSGPWQLAVSVTGGSVSSTTDTPSSASGVVLYHVIAKSGSTLSPASNNDVAFVGTFANDAFVRAEHLTQIRIAVNGLADIAGQLPIYTAANLDPASLRYQAINYAHFTSLMTNLNTARGWNSLPPVSFRVTPVQGGRIYQTQIDDLRLGVK